MGTFRKFILILPTRRLEVRVLSLPGYGEKQQFKGTLMRMNGQEEIGNSEKIAFEVVHSWEKFQKQRYRKLSLLSSKISGSVGYLP